MRSTNVGNDGGVGRSQLRQYRDLARMIHSDLPNSNFILGGRLQHCPRKADMIVEITLRFCNVKTAAENRRSEIFRARLAVASRDRDHLKR